MSLILENRTGPYRVLTALCTGHFMVDLCQGILPLTLPFLLTKLNLNYTATGLIVMTAYITSSIVQPVFGFSRYRLGRNLALFLGVPIATSGLLLAVCATTYPLLLAAVVMCSLGTAMFHPEAAARSHQIGLQKNSDRNMSAFVLCGSFGFTSGAMIFGPILGAVGLSGIYWLIIPAVFTIIYMIYTLPGSARNLVEKKAGAPISLRLVMRRMTMPVLVVALRQCAMAGVVSLLPLYFTNYLHRTAFLAGWMMFALQIGGDIGMLSCSQFTKRLGYQRSVMVGLLLAAIPLGLLTIVPDWLAAMLLFSVGFLLSMPLLGITLLGQQLLPENRPLAASLTMGVGVGAGGVASGLLGHAADVYGITHAMEITAGLALAAGLLSFSLPQKSSPEAPVNA